MSYDSGELQANMALLYSNQPLKQEIGFQNLRPHAHEIVEQVAERIRVETNASVREYLAALLAEGRTSKAHSILASLLEDSNPKVRFWASYGLGVALEIRAPYTDSPKGLGIIEGQTNAYFKETASGWVIFPWGIWGKGYILPNQLEKQKARKIIKRWTIVVWLIALINPFVLVGLQNKWLVGVGLGVIEILMIQVVHWAITSRLTKGLPVSNERLTWVEVHRGTAQSYHEGVLWGGAGFSLLAEILAIIGLVATLMEKAPAHIILFAFMMVILWAVTLGWYIYMLSVKSKPR